MGALGDLQAWLENKRRVARRQLGDVISSPNDFGRMQAARFREDQEKYMSDPAAGLDFVGGPLGALAGVIKPKGGNWLTGSVEKALAPLKTLPSPPPGGSVVEVPSMNAAGATLLKYLDSAGDVYEAREFMPPQLQQARALDRWVEGPLTKYMKTQMATPEDPVRALAEQGILHYSPELYSNSLNTRVLREEGGFPVLGMASKGPGGANLAEKWERQSDSVVDMRRVGQYLDPDMKASDFREAWMEKVDPQTPVYEASGTANTLGFDHLLDEMRNALDPNSGLPRELQLRPEQLQQMGMEKAVRHVHAINEWRAAQKAATDAELAGKASVVREYAENNPKGLRWVELKDQKPTELPSGWEFRPDRSGNLISIYDSQGIERSIGSTKEEALGLLNRAEREAELARQLRYEGDTMGHCVGGYCPDVLSGKSRIFSLRDAKGEPHVTVEAAPKFESAAGTKRSVEEHLRSAFPDVEYKLRPVGSSDKSVIDYEVVFDRPVMTNSENPLFPVRHGQDERMAAVLQDVSKSAGLEGLRADYWPRGVGKTTSPTMTLSFRKPLSPSAFDVVQIKGKQNLAPKEEYLPFVQDFVRNSPLGSWGSVGDIRNARLEKIGNQYMTKEEMLNIIDDINHPNWAEVNDALQRSIDDWEPY